MDRTQEAGQGKTPSSLPVSGQAAAGQCGASRGSLGQGQVNLRQATSSQPHQPRAHQPPLLPPPPSLLSGPGTATKEKPEKDGASPIRNEIGRQRLDLSGPPKCSGCGRVIADRYLNHVLGAFWHGACLVCTECRLPLQKSCFQNEGKFYCGIHFFRRFGTRCRGCGEGIPPSELVRRAHDNVYHLRCFTCAVCGTRLDTGDQFYLRTDHSLVCRADFERARHSCTTSTTTDDDEDDTSQPSTKRPRASINNKQLEELKNAYNVSRKPSRNMREELGKKLGLDVRVVQVWFQNRRAKEKRLKREVDSSLPFGASSQGEGFPSAVPGVEDIDSPQPSVYNVPGKHAMMVATHDGPRTDFYAKQDGTGLPSTEAPSSVSLSNHNTLTCGTNGWSSQSYPEDLPQRDAFSSPPHQQRLFQGKSGGPEVQAAIQGAIVCTATSAGNGVAPRLPSSGQLTSYELNRTASWEASSGVSSDNKVNGSFSFHSL